jgi:hypothetical protein
VPVELETKDPIASLQAKSIHDRCAAARDLSKIGALDVIPLLADRARDDRSPAVRLATAGAAADILSRFRLPPGRDALDGAQRTELLELFKGIDPGANAGLFPMLACLDLPLAFSRIATGLRDPRGGVRVGAAVGLMRLCISRARLGDAQLEADVIALLRDNRLRPDALAEVARVCAAGGYTSALLPLQRLDLGGAHGDFVDEMVDILQQASDPLQGFWFSDGLDAGEIDPEPDAGPAALVVVDDAVFVHLPRVGWKSIEDLHAQGLRRLHYRRAGAAEAGAAVQALGRTWYPPTDAEEAMNELMVATVDLPSIEWGSAGSTTEAAGLVADTLLPSLGDTSVEYRTAAILLQLAGRPEESLVALEASAARKKCNPDTWLYLGDARQAKGDAAGATVAWENTVRKIRKKSHWARIRAQERLGVE